MKYAGSLLALAVLVLAVVLFPQQDIGAIAALLVEHEPGLMLAGLFHVVRMPVSAAAWWLLYQRTQRPRLVLLVFTSWIRESVNALLPVARVGGEVAAFRVLRTRNVAGVDIASTLIVD